MEQICILSLKFNHWLLSTSPFIPPPPLSFGITTLSLLNMSSSSTDSSSRMLRYGATCAGAAFLSAGQPWRIADLRICSVLSLSVSSWISYSRWSEIGEKLAILTCSKSAPAVCSVLGRYALDRKSAICISVPFS